MRAWFALLLIVLPSCTVPALREVDLDLIEDDLEAAFAARDDTTLLALDRSIDWLSSEDAEPWFEQCETVIDRDAVVRGVLIVREELLQADDATSFIEQLRGRVRFLASTGRDGGGEVLFTGYFAPEYPGSLVRTDRFRFPLFAPPLDLDPVQPWATRREIEDDELLAGTEIAWLADPLDAYLVHVNGSARLRLPDGDMLCVGHDGTNNRPYTSLGRLLIEAGLAAPDEMSMQRIRALHRGDPAHVETLMRENDRYVFFRRLDPDRWPRGALGITLSEGASLATDRAVFPPGAAVLVVTTAAEPDGTTVPLARFACDQDTGGAITTPGRADFYFGVGEAAGERAGRQVATGRMYYILGK